MLQKCAGSRVVAGVNPLDSAQAARYHAPMQHMMPILSLLPLAAMAFPAVAQTSPEEVCEQLRKALSAELSALRSLKDAESAAANLPALEQSLAALAAMDRSPEAEATLWQYIDNAENDVKMQLVELLQAMTLEFMRLEEAKFFDSKKLRSVLLPQMRAPKAAAR